MAKKTKIEIEFSAINKGFNDAIKNIGKDITTLNKEFSLQREEMKLTGTVSEKMEASLSKLKKEYALTSDKVSQSEKAFANANEMMGGNSEEARRWGNALLDAQRKQQLLDNAISTGQGALSSYKTSMGQVNALLDVTGKELEDFSDAIGKDMVSAIRNGTAGTDQLESAIEKMGKKAYGAGVDVDDMKRKLSGVSDGNAIDRITLKFQGLSKQLEGAQKKIEGAGKKLQEFGGKLTTRITLPIVGIGIASFKMAAELEDSMGAIDQIYGGASDAVKNWADSLPSYYGIAKGEATEYASVMGAMLQNIGQLSEEESAEQAATLIQLAGDLSAMFGGTTEEAVNALTGALKGNNTMLDNYGMGVNEATIKAKAFEMGLYSGTGEMTLAAKQAATLALIMEQTADAQGQAGREAESASGSIKSTTTEMKNLSTEIGGTLIPLLQPAIDKVQEVVNTFKELPEEQKLAIVNFALLAGALGPVISIIGGFLLGVGNLIGLFMAGGPLAAIGTTIAGISAPVAIAIAVIVGLIAFLVANWEGVKASVMEIVASIVEWWESVKTKVGESIQGMIEIATNNLNELGEGLSNIWNAITSAVGTAWGFIVGIFATVWGVITGIFDGAKTTVINIITGLTTGATNLFNNLKCGATNIWNAITTVISTAITNAQAKVGAVVNGIKTSMTDAFNSAKSTVLNIFDSIKSGISDKINAAKDVVSNVIDKIKSIFNFSWSLPQLKLPRVSITGKFGLNPPSWPKFNLEWYDKGGIFDRPSVIGVGEKRPEFVGALDDLKMLIREVFDEREGRTVVGGGGTTIIIKDANIYDQRDIRTLSKEIAKEMRREGL